MRKSGMKTETVLVPKVITKSQPKDEHGHYFVNYVLTTPPKGTDPDIWNVAVADYLQRNGVDLSSVTPSTTMANTDWPEIRRIYNRLIGEGKQRRSVNSHEAKQVEILKVKGE